MESGTRVQLPPVWALPGRVVNGATVTRRDQEALMVLGSQAMEGGAVAVEEGSA